MGICVAIVMGALTFNLIYNLVISLFKLDHKTIILEKEEDLLASMIMKKGNKIKIRDSFRVWEKI